MHGNHGFRLEQAAGIGGLFRTHGKHVADGQYAQIWLVQFPDDGHVAEDVGVSGMVDLEAVCEFNHEATGFAAADGLVSVFNGAGMIGVDHGDHDVSHWLRATLVHGSDVFRALLLRPHTKLIYADNFGVMLLGQFNGVAKMVTVAVRAEHNVN